MTNRSAYEIIYDLLKVIKGRECRTPLQVLYDRAKISSPYMRQKYVKILESSGLAITTGHARSDFIEITPKGFDYIEAYDKLERILRSGLPDYPHPVFESFPE